MSDLTSMKRLIDIMAALREPETGCPWDVQQTFSTIAPYTIEEAYEVADAIERNDFDDLKDELGDLLLQVVFHARMAEEGDVFTFEDVAEAICRKMIRRHPHVFGEKNAETPGEVKTNWESIKAEEKADRAKALGTTREDTSVLDDVALSLPALMRAEKLQKRAARVGFDWPEDDAVYDKLDEEIGELKTAVASGVQNDIEDEIGDLLFTVVNLARRYKIDPEVALRGTNQKFKRRFNAVEKQASTAGKNLSDLSLTTFDGYWNTAKSYEDTSD